MSDSTDAIRADFRVAVVGAGPSGFYAADALLRSELPIEVDVYERLAAPFGLVRHGVAPDHPKLKATIKFSSVSQNTGGSTFAAEWIKRGPMGSIGTNKACSDETAGHVVEYLRTSTKSETKRGFAALRHRAGRTVVSFQDWRRLNTMDL